MINEGYMGYLEFVERFKEWWSNGIDRKICEVCGSVMWRMYWCEYDEDIDSDVECWGFMCVNCGEWEGI